MTITVKYFALILLSIWAFAAVGGSLTVPHTFTSGEKALASEVNENFTAVKTEVDDNDLRMPGVAYVNEGTCCTDVTTIAVAHQSVTVDAPTSGYVTVSYTGDCRLYHINAASTIIQSLTIAISTNSANVVTDNRRTFSIPGNAGTGLHSISCTTQQVFPVTTGSATFYLNAQAVLPTNGETASIGWGNLHAVFVPNQY